jgi:hypothetical protein
MALFVRMLITAMARTSAVMNSRLLVKNFVATELVLNIDRAIVLPPRLLHRHNVAAVDVCPVNILPRLAVRFREVQRLERKEHTSIISAESELVYWY